jgi:hypothetical protein
LVSGGTEGSFVLSKNPSLLAEFQLCELEDLDNSFALFLGLPSLMMKPDELSPLSLSFSSTIDMEFSSGFRCDSRVLEKYPTTSHLTLHEPRGLNDLCTYTVTIDIVF